MFFANEILHVKCRYGYLCLHSRTLLETSMLMDEKQRKNVIITQCESTLVIRVIHLINLPLRLAPLIFHHEAPEKVFSLTKH